LSFETSAGFSREVATAPLNFSAAAVLVVVIQFALSQPHHLDAHVGTAQLSDCGILTSDSVMLGQATDLSNPRNFTAQPEIGPRFRATGISMNIDVMPSGFNISTMVYI
jgi:hypothetical protein